MENKEIVERKLNFFQRLRRSFYLRNLTDKKISKYVTLPDYLKQDKEVIDALMKKDEKNIEIFSEDIQVGLIKENPDRLQIVDNYQVIEKVIMEKPELFTKLTNYEVLEKIITKKPEFFTKLSNDKIRIFLFFENKFWNCVKLLPIELQKELLTKKMSWTYESSFNYTQDILAQRTFKRFFRRSNFNGCT